LSEVYAKAGVAVQEMDKESMDLWRKVAAESAWKDFSERSKYTARFMQMAESV
jgi:hypothetical protein